MGWPHGHDWPFSRAAGLTFLLETAKDNFDIILQIGAGTGLLYLVRWFWWRINAWCEVVAMTSSFAVSVALLVLHKCGIATSTHMGLLITIGVTTVCWFLTVFIAPQTDRKTLIAFYKKVKPFGPGWSVIRKEAGVSLDEAKATHQNIPLGLLGWVAGCTVIYSSLFAIGNFLYGRRMYAIGLSCVFIISGVILLYVIRKLWESNGKVNQ